MARGSQNARKKAAALPVAATRRRTDSKQVETAQDAQARVRAAAPEALEKEKERLKFLSRQSATPIPEYDDASSRRERGSVRERLARTGIPPGARNYGRPALCEIPGQGIKLIRVWTAVEAAASTRFQRCFALLEQARNAVQPEPRSPAGGTGVVHPPAKVTRGLRAERVKERDVSACLDALGKELVALRAQLEAALKLDGDTLALKSSAGLLGGTNVETPPFSALLQLILKNRKDRFESTDVFRAHLMGRLPRLGKPWNGVPKIEELDSFKINLTCGRKGPWESSWPKLYEIARTIGLLPPAENRPPVRRPVRKARNPV